MGDVELTSKQASGTIGGLVKQLPESESRCTDTWGALMVSAHDVAAYILLRRGVMTAMKLQKLVYYAQAWSLVWDEKPLFGEKIQAWANGPVVPELYAEHRRMFDVSSWPKGNADALSIDERETVDAVLEFYGAKSSQWLSDLTHMEAPWCGARKGLAPGTRGNEEISHASMAMYYGGLAATP